MTADLVNAPPLAALIDDSVPFDSVESDSSLAVPPVERQRQLRRRAFHHLVCWWSWSRSSGLPTFDSEGGLERVARAWGSATSHAEAVVSMRDEWMDGDRDFDEEAAKLALDSARFDRLYAETGPPYDEPDGYAQYDDEVVAELVALVDELDAEVLADGVLTLESRFGLSPSVAVEPPQMINVVDEMAYTVVVGADPHVPEDIWRELVGCVLLDDLVDRVEFRWHPPEEELTAVEGIEYSDPADQGEVTLLTLTTAMKDVIADVLRNQDQLGWTDVSHAPIDEVGVYFANRGDLQTVDTHAIRQEPGYHVLWEAFVEQLVSTAEHSGFARIVDHFVEWNVDDRI